MMVHIRDCATLYRGDGRDKEMTTLVSGVEQTGLLNSSVAEGSLLLADYSAYSDPGGLGRYSISTNSQTTTLLQQYNNSTHQFAEQGGVVGPITTTFSLMANSDFRLSVAMPEQRLRSSVEKAHRRTLNIRLKISFRSHFCVKNSRHYDFLK